MRLWLSAINELLCRYGTIFSAVWRERANLESPKRTLDERQFLPAHLELIETPVSAAPKAVARLIILFILAAFIWAMVGQVEIVAVATGKTVPAGNSKTIQPLETSVIKKIYVKDGDRVNAGDHLIDLEGIGSDSDFNQSMRQLEAALLTRLRNQALLRGLDSKTLPFFTQQEKQSYTFNEKELTEAEHLLQNQYQTWLMQDEQAEAILQQNKAKLRSVCSQIIKLKNIGFIEKRRLQDFKKLLEKKYLSQHEYYEQQSKLIQNDQDLASLYEDQREVEESIHQVEKERNLNTQSLKRDTLDYFRQSNEDIAQLREQLSKTRQRQSLMALKAPVSGTVQQLAFHTEGGVIMEGQPAMLIAPENDKIDIEIMVANKDIGFVKAGQDVVVKIESFPYTRYGYLNGKVQHVSFDAVEKDKMGLIFTGRVNLKQSSIKVEDVNIPLNAGMNITAEIKTGKRRVIDYLLSPLQSTIDNSFIER